MKTNGKKLRVDTVDSICFFSMEDTGDMTISEEDKRRFISLVDPKSADLAKSLVNGELDFTYVEYYEKNTRCNPEYNGYTCCSIDARSIIVIASKRCDERIIELNDRSKGMSDDDIEFIKSIVTRCGDKRACVTFGFRASGFGDALSEYIDAYNNAPNTLPMSIRKMLYNMYGKLSDSDKLLFEIGEKNLDWDNL